MVFGSFVLDASRLDEYLSTNQKKINAKPNVDLICTYKRRDYYDGKDYGDFNKHIIIHDFKNLNEINRGAVFVWHTPNEFAKDVKKNETNYKIYWESEKKPYGIEFKIIAENWAGNMTTDFLKYLPLENKGLQKSSLGKMTFECKEFAR